MVGRPQLSSPLFNCPHATETSEPYVRWHGTIYWLSLYIKSVNQYAIAGTSNMVSFSADDHAFYDSWKFDQC